MDILLPSIAIRPTCAGASSRARSFDSTVITTPAQPLDETTERNTTPAHIFFSIPFLLFGAFVVTRLPRNASRIQHLLVP
jgi:hypothetical protein